LAPIMVCVRPTPAFLRTLRVPLWADAQRDIDLALKAALLLEHGVPPGRVAARLGISEAEAREAVKRARWACEQRENG
jgi:DNA-directed RNA polymerase specialized sigma24 family protein